MKIGFFLENYIAGGVDTVLVNKINSWANERDELILFCNKGHDGLERILKPLLSKRCRIIELPFPTIIEMAEKVKLVVPEIVVRIAYYFGKYILYPVYTWLIFRLVKKYEFDTIYIHNGGYPGADLARAAILGAKWAEINNIFHIIHSLASGVRKGQWIFEFLIDRIVDKYAKVICVSKQSAFSVEKNRAIRQPIEVVYNGVLRPKTEKEIDEKIKKEIEVLAEGKIVIGMVGRLDPGKGHEDLIDAINCLRKNEKIPPFICLIFGKGSEERSKYLQKIVTEKKMEREIVFCGFRSNIVDYYKHFNMLVFPSLGYESFPMTILEAMSFALPVVATDVGGTAEMIDNESTGLILPPCNPKLLADAMQRLLQNQDERERMGNNAYQKWVKEFNAKKMSERYRQLCKEAIDL